VVSKNHLVRKASVLPDSNSETLCSGKPTVRKESNLSTMQRTPQHCRSLPSSPKTHKDLKGYPYEREFREAEKNHLKSHEELRTWRIVAKSAD
jgi:hypothetical protein